MLAYIFYAFIFLFIINLLYLFLFGNFAFSKNRTSIQKNFPQPVSVVICAKNEAANLKKHLPYFVNQNYSKFELVLVNDGSTDNTLEVIENYESQYPFIKVVNVIPNEQFWGSKKYALTLGIKAAKYSHLLFSDADCKPKSEYWIREMMGLFSEKKQLVLGYGAYTKIKNSFLNKLIRYETLLTAVQYFSYAKLGFPYMGVGRNLAYTKDLFFKHSGFVNHMLIPSGDDDLFVNSAANSKNTALQFSIKSHTISIPEKTWKSWIHQKSRHISTASHYTLKHKFALSLFFTSKIVMLLLGAILILFKYHLAVVLLGIAFYYLFMYLVFGLSSKKLDEKDLIFLLPILDLCLICAQLFIFIKNIHKKPSHW